MKRLALLCSLALGACLAVPAVSLAADEFDKYALESASASLSSTQAGAHADLTVEFELTENVSEARPYALTRDVIVQLPPGMIGNPQGFPRCTLAQFGQKPKESICPQDAQVGVSEITLAGEINGTLTEPIYNMPAPAAGGIVARFGLFAGPYPSFINVRVDPSDYSLVAAVEGAPGAAELISARTTFWGVPAADSHDTLRLTPLEGLNTELPAGGRPSGQPLAPFLSNPTDCSGGRELSVTAVSYQVPHLPSTVSAPFPALGGCGKVGFNPSLEITPTNPGAAAPTGLDAVLEIPQDETANGLATSTLRSAVVTLPEGMAINPAAADGLEACDASQARLGQAREANCPDAAKLGTATFEVPALEEPLEGALYQRNPAGDDLFRLWLIADGQGVHLKLPARIEADPATGQLTNLFLGLPALGGNPQVPVSEISLRVFGGPRAPLRTPSACGDYEADYELAPWSGREPATGQAKMSISSACEKGGFAPGLTAGTIDPTAGAFSPFALSLTQRDGEANLSSLAVTLPEGLLAKLAGVPLCPEAAAPSGACPAASRIGSVAAATGVGSSPLWVPQPGKAPTAIYLAGPYKGSPYSLVASVPAQAGPFDLGTVVTRAAISIDPVTAKASVATDPLPQILEGVPVTYRALHVLVDRPGFTLNPTGCEPKQVTAYAGSADGRLAALAAPYRAVDCAALGFKPRLGLRLKGGVRRGANPALRSVYTPRPGDANLKRLALRFPRTAFLDQSHIRTVCTRVQFAAGAGHGSACPEGSVYGRARVWTPILERPLEGPVFLRSSNNKLPDLVLALDGQVQIEASARIDSARGAIRAIFTDIPDAPLSRVVVAMQGGKKGLIVNSRHLCFKPKRNRAEARYAAQSAKRAAGRPVVRAAACGKQGKRARRAQKRAR